MVNRYAEGVFKDGVSSFDCAKGTGNLAAFLEKQRKKPGAASDSRNDDFLLVLFLVKRKE